MPIPILFQNESLFIVDKPAGLATIPERTPGASSTLEQVTQETGQKLWVVHRLDKEVSGVLVFAKNAETHKFLNQSFETRRVKKAYAAVVHGIVKPDSDVIEKPIREFGSGRMGVDVQKGKPCETGFSVERRLEKFTRLRVFPLTGRRHQIRVHLYAIGHPIAGDPLYGDPAIQKNFPRLLLHAFSIDLPQPDDSSIHIEAPLPSAFNL